MLHVVSQRYNQSLSIEECSIRWKWMPLFRSRLVERKWEKAQVAPCSKLFYMLGLERGIETFDHLLGSEPVERQESMQPAVVSRGEKLVSSLVESIIGSVRENIRNSIDWINQHKSPNVATVNASEVLFDAKESRWNCGIWNKERILTCR